VPSKTPRRSQAERREATRLALLNATIDTLFESGYAGLRLSAITARSGVSGGALVHHFGSKRELIVAVADYAFEQQLAVEFDMVDKALHADDPLSVMLEAQRMFYLNPMFVVHTELSAAARSEPALAGPIREVTAKHQSRRDEAWLNMLVARGFERAYAGIVIEMTFHIWRSLGLRYFRDPTRRQELEDRSASLFETWRTMLRSITPETIDSSE
jgi:AcrR family transcriptional regulator